MASERRLRSLQIGMTAAAKRGGGLDRYYFDLLRALPAAGVDVTGLVAGDPASIADPVAGVESFASDGVSMLGRWRGLRATVPALAAKADLVVAHFAPYAFPVLDTLAKRPLLVQFQGPWALESAVEGASRAKVVLRGLVERVVYSRAIAFIVLSNAFRDVLHDEYGVAVDKIRTIKPGVDLARFTALGTQDESRDALGWPRGRPIVVTVRRLVHAKGLELLVEAVETIRRDVPDVLVQIIGTGPLEAVLRAAIVERGLGDNVRLVGHVAEPLLRHIYRAADLSVVPTIALEGFGLIVVESLACGTPALVTPVGGLPEVVEDLDTGLVLAGATAADIARGITSALLEPSRLPSKADCVAFSRRFDWHSVAERTAAVYREIA